MELTTNTDITICKRKGYISVKADTNAPQTFYFGSFLYLHLVFTDTENSLEETLGIESADCLNTAESVTETSFSSESEIDVVSDKVWGLVTDPLHIIDQDCIEDRVAHTKQGFPSLEDISQKQISSEEVPVGITALKQTDKKSKRCAKRAVPAIMNEKKPACPHCSITLNSNSALRRHLKYNCDKKMEKPVSKAVYGRASEELSDSEMHENDNHLNENELSCVNETYEEPRLDSRGLSKPVERSRTVEGFPAKGYTCDICDLRVHTLHQLRRHKKEAHMLDHVFSCNLCGEDFRFMYSLADHKQNVCQYRKKHICKFCNEEFSMAKELRSHSKVHGLFCELCKEQFDLKGHLQIHLKEKHLEDVDSMGNKLVKSCPECVRVFLSDDRLEAHLTSHGFIKPFVCYKCGHMFSSSKSLNYHIGLHDTSCGTNSVCCELCGAQCKTEKSLRAHTLQVHAKKSYKCRECPKAFNNSYKLSLHKRTHTKEKPYVCGVCSKGFSQRYNMVVHMRTHTREKPFSCGICSLSFGHRCSLQGHMRSVHTNTDT